MHGLLHEKARKSSPVSCRSWLYFFYLSLEPWKHICECCSMFFVLAQHHLDTKRQQSGTTSRQKLLGQALDISVGCDRKGQSQVYQFSQQQNCHRLCTKTVKKMRRQKTTTRPLPGPVFHPSPNYAFLFSSCLFRRIPQSIALIILYNRKAIIAH